MKSICYWMVIFIVHMNNVHAWNYFDQSIWQSEFPKCSGDHQSPIELSMREAQIPARPLPSLKFYNYDRIYESVEISNNGHTAQIMLQKPIDYAWPDGDDTLAYITGGNLPLHDKFIIESIHFHWGKESGSGSEHSIDGQRFSMEMHMVHRNSKYETAVEASEEPDGLAVLSVMFDVQPALTTPVPGFQQLVTALPFVEEAYSGKEITNFNISKLIENLNTKKFLTYEGSLTTPPCAEAVTWHIFTEPLDITLEQLSEFRILFDGAHIPLMNNFRTMQSRNGRSVYMHL